MTKEENYEWQYYADEHITVVALNATLDYFKAIPVTINGKPECHFRERTIKDCRFLDGCIYLAPGRVRDNTMTDMVTRFNNIKKHLKKNDAHGKIVMKGERIIPILTRQNKK